MVTSAEMIYKWANHLIIDHQPVEVRLKKNNICICFFLFNIFLFIYQMVDVRIHQEIQVHSHLCVLEMAIVVVVLFHQQTTFVKVQNFFSNHSRKYHTCFFINSTGSIGLTQFNIKI